MTAEDPILAAACNRFGCDSPAQDRYDGYCSEKCQEADR